MGKTSDRVKFFYDISRLTIAAHEHGIELLPHCFHRLQKQQDILYEDGKSDVKHSKHQDWLAMDFVIIKDGKAVWKMTADYEWLGKTWEKMGHTWGGNWSRTDAWHFEN